MGNKMISETGWIIDNVVPYFKKLVKTKPHKNKKMLYIQFTLPNTVPGIILPIFKCSGVKYVFFNSMIFCNQLLLSKNPHLIFSGFTLIVYGFTLCLLFWKYLADEGNSPGLNLQVRAPDRLPHCWQRVWNTLFLSSRPFKLKRLN